jgi:hypothetical protein
VLISAALLVADKLPNPLNVLFAVVMRVTSLLEANIAPVPVFSSMKMLLKTFKPEPTRVITVGSLLAAVE